MPVRVGLKHIDIWNDSMEKAVCKYEEEPIEKGQIVFYGPSNFTRWSAKWNHTPLREALLGKRGKPCAINRGFGSSCSEHQLYYYPRMVRSLEPKVLVYSPFGNYKSFGYSAEEAWELAQRVIVYALTDFPDIHIYICSPHRRRVNTEEALLEMQKCASLAKEFAANTPNCHYLNLLDYAPLHSEDVFVEDGTHYNQKGYDIYADFFRNALKAEFDCF